MIENGVTQVFGMPQIFSTRNDDSQIVLLIAKLVDDFLLAGDPTNIRNIHNAIVKRLKLEGSLKVRTTSSTAFKSTKKKTKASPYPWNNTPETSKRSHSL